MTPSSSTSNGSEKTVSVNPGGVTSSTRARAPSRVARAQGLPNRLSKERGVSLGSDYNRAREHARRLPHACEIPPFKNGEMMP
jgi:hypothetical protein